MRRWNKWFTETFGPGLGVLASLCTVLLFVAGVIGGLYKFVRQVHAAPQLPTKSISLRDAVAVVRSEATGKPIGAAKIFITADNSTPITKYSDSEGDIKFQLPSTASNIQVTVTATGYELYQRTLAEWSSTFEDLRLTPSSHHSKSSKLNTPAVPSPVISAPNGIAIGGGTVNNPSVVNNYGVPAPIPDVSFRVEALPATGRFNHSVVHVTLSGELENPLIGFHCLLTCRVQPELMGTVDVEPSPYLDAFRGVILRFNRPHSLPGSTDLTFNVTTYDPNPAEVFGVQVGSYR